MKRKQNSIHCQLNVFHKKSDEKSVHREQILIWSLIN